MPCPAAPAPAGEDESTLTCLRRLRWSIPAALAAALAICWGAVTYWIEIGGFESGVDVSTEAPPGVKGWPR